MARHAERDGNAHNVRGRGTFICFSYRINARFAHCIIFCLVQETQTELVMLILLRLAEDVITFQTLPQQRRRDIQHTLTLNMDSIFSFLLTILQQHVDEYRKLVGCYSRVDLIIINGFFKNYLFLMFESSLFCSLENNPRTGVKGKAQTVLILVYR